MKLKLERLIRPEKKTRSSCKKLYRKQKIPLAHFIKSSINNNIRCILVITGKKKTLNGSKGLIRKNCHYG